MNIRPVNSDILFEFQDFVSTNGYFREQSRGGILIAQSQLTALQSSGDVRIATVVAVGPECTVVKEGMRVMIEPLKWTPQFEVNGKTLWKTDEEFIIGVVD